MRVGMEGLDVGFQERHQSLKGVEPLARNECGALTNSSGGQMQVTGKTLPHVSTSLGRPAQSCESQEDHKGTSLSGRTS